MKCSVRYIGIILIGLWLLIFSACDRDHPRVQELLAVADSLSEANPDSAFYLLDSLHVRERMSKGESARYALLLAKATDKTYRSLLPCDSLLNFALSYYTHETPRRVTALLYKARLEYEVNHMEDAIKHLQEALVILDKYPDETDLHRLCLSSLGNLYYEYDFYDECFRIYQQLSDYCEDNEDKAIASYSLASYFTMTENRDSAFFYHDKAIEFADLSGNYSLKANLMRAKGSAFRVFEESDSALYYIQKAIDIMPVGESKSPYLYALGNSLIDMGYENLDSIKGIFNAILADSTYEDKYLSYRALGAIDADLNDFQSAYNNLNEYINIFDTLYTAERSVDVQQLIYDYNTKLRLQEARMKSERLVTAIAFVGFIVIVVVIGIYQYQIYKRRKKQMELQNLIDNSTNTISYLNNIIKENSHTIKMFKVDMERLHRNLLSTQAEYLRTNESYQQIKKQYALASEEMLKGKHEFKNAIEEYEHMKAEYEATRNRYEDTKIKYEQAKSENSNLLHVINQYEEQSNELKKQVFNIRRQVFDKTDICVVIRKLGEQRAKDAKHAKVLNADQRKILKTTINKICNDHIQNILANYKGLNEDDLLLICLKEMEIKSVDIALCFGYTDTNAINQRIHRIREKGYKF